MFKSKSQTSTEYLIILAVVILIALIVIGVLGGIPSIGGGMSTSTAKLNLASAKVAVVNYAISDYDVKLKIKNNQPERIKINKITLDGTPCFSIDSFTLTPGSSKTVTCIEVNSQGSSKAELPIVISWTDLSIGANYIQNSSDLQLVGSVADKYLGILQSNPYWDSALDGCWDATANPRPICTCVDLNKIRTTHLSSNYLLQNSIDFNRCEEVFGADFVSGSGWTPIGDMSTKFTGDFDGMDYIIGHLTINRGATNNQGLFGILSGGSISSLGLTHFSIVGGTSSGGLVGSLILSSSVLNSFASGSTSGTSNVGGLVGYSAYSSSIANSYVLGSISGTSDVGGLVGENYHESTIFNSFVSGSVTGGSNVGGLVGQNYYYTATKITNSYWYNISGVNHCGLEKSLASGCFNGGVQLCAKSDCSDRYADLGWSP